jgi:hypothetical protein
VSRTDLRRLGYPPPFEPRTALVAGVPPFQRITRRTSTWETQVRVSHPRSVFRRSAAAGACEEEGYEAVENHTAMRSPTVLAPSETNAKVRPEMEVLSERNRDVRS